MEIISFQFMQGLVNQFKEFELYFNNNQELLKAFSQEGESSNLDLTKSKIILTGIWRTDWEGGRGIESEQKVIVLFWTGDVGGLKLGNAEGMEKRRQVQHK